jgi:hypothetical protein
MSRVDVKTAPVEKDPKSIHRVSPYPKRVADKIPIIRTVTYDPLPAETVKAANATKAAEGLCIFGMHFLISALFRHTLHFTGDGEYRPTAHTKYHL